MTTEEMMKQQTDKDISHYGEESIKKGYDRWKTGIRRSEEQGWIVIGELEWGDHFPFGKFKEEEAYFLFARSIVGDEKASYEYCFGKIFTNPMLEGWWFNFDKRYSINTILTFFISQDLQFASMGNPVLKSEHLKIRLVGNQDWLYPNVEFLNGVMQMDELEKKFRSNKPQISLF